MHYQARLLNSKNNSCHIWQHREHHIKGPDLHQMAGRGLVFPIVQAILSFFHPIDHAEGLAVALELAFGTVEEIANLDIGTLIL